MASSKKMIGVIGGNSCTADESGLAERVGALIARAGAILICGGMAGIMEAACKGAAEAGGTTIGILPTADAGEANKYVQIPIVTGMGIGRNIIIVRSAAALIAVGGKYGTLSEIAYALQLNKKVFSLNSWEIIPGIIPMKTPEAAVDAALNC